MRKQNFIKLLKSKLFLSMHRMFTNRKRKANSQTRITSKLLGRGMNGRGMEKRRIYSSAVHSPAISKFTLNIQTKGWAPQARLSPPQEKGQHEAGLFPTTSTQQTLTLGP